MVILNLLKLSVNANNQHVCAFLSAIRQGSGMGAGWVSACFIFSLTSVLREPEAAPPSVKHPYSWSTVEEGPLTVGLLEG